jgi:hypothetical protein
MSLAEAQDRAERLFRQRQEGTKALQEYRAKQEATRNLTANRAFGTRSNKRQT